MENTVRVALPPPALFGIILFAGVGLGYFVPVRVLPESLTRFAKSPLGLGAALYPVPMLCMLIVSALGAVYLQRTVMGRHVFAVGGNAEASRFSGLRLGRIQVGVYVLAGLTAGLSAFLGSGFYGSVSCGDATGYELYVIASAVVGGARLSGGRGSAVNAMLGAVLIVLIRQSIRTLHLDQNYEWIIIGCAIVIAVVLDQASARFAARRLAQGDAGGAVRGRLPEVEDGPDRHRGGHGRWHADAGGEADSHRDDREELDQPGVSLGPPRRRDRLAGPPRTDGSRSPAMSAWDRPRPCRRGRRPQTASLR